MKTLKMGRTPTRRHGQRSPLVNLRSVVTNTLDDGSTGSLPWAINLAISDTSSLPVLIDFDIAPGTVLS